MLSRLLSEHAAGCFYSDDNLSNYLWDSLISGHNDLFNDRWSTLQNNCYSLLVSSLDVRYPQKFRLNDIRSLMRIQCNESLFLGPALPWIEELSESLLVRNGDLLHYKESRVQEYVKLAAEMDPALIVAWRIARWIKESPTPQLHDIRRVISGQAPFFAPPTNSVKPYAENHVHIWGVTSENIIFSQLLFQGKLSSSTDIFSNFELSNGANLTEQIKKAKALFAYIIDASRQIGKEKNISFTVWLNQNSTSNWASIDWELLAQIPSNSDEFEVERQLIELAAAITQEEPNCWLRLQVLLSCSYQDIKTSPYHRIAILCFLQIMNGLRRHIIMDGQGLTRFVERYFANPLRKVGNRYNDNFRQIFAGTSDVAEIKSGPMSFSKKNVKAISEAMLSTFKGKSCIPPYVFGEHEINPSENLTHLEILERWQFCGHFSRSIFHGKNNNSQKDLKRAWKEADKLFRRINENSGWNKSVFLGGKLNQNFHFRPNRWFRGLDVAGDENGLKIEYFAPILRWLRSGLHSKPESESATKDFHFSIHSGEDYNHPLSGMRHIDETVRFCEMREGDRIGHALALGIDPLEWVQRQGEMIVDVDEHLDNLVWMWHYATLLSGTLPLAQQVTSLLERRITRFCRKIDWLKVPSFYDEKLVRPSFDLFRILSEDIKPDTLYRAWLLRRNCIYKFNKLDSNLPITSQEQIALPDWKSLTDESNLESKIYKNRHSTLQKAKVGTKVIVRFGSEWDSQKNIGLSFSGKQEKAHLIEDVDTEAELNFMAALQDYLLSQYDMAGIIIETNPTSNLYISRLESYSEHPIFRWNPPDTGQLESGSKFNRFGLRRGPVKVLVNTDDPGIVPTTLRTEYLLLRKAALDLGFGSTVVETWLDSVRQLGVEQFYKNHLPVFELH